MPPRRKCKLADSEYRDTDLRKYRKLIVTSFEKVSSNSVLTSAIKSAILIRKFYLMDGQR